MMHSMTAHVQKLMSNLMLFMYVIKEERSFIFCLKCRAFGVHKMWFDFCLRMLDVPKFPWSTFSTICLPSSTKMATIHERTRSLSKNFWNRQWRGERIVLLQQIGGGWGCFRGRFVMMECVWRKGGRIPVVYSLDHWNSRRRRWLIRMVASLSSHNLGTFLSP